MDLRIEEASSSSRWEAFLKDHEKPEERDEETEAAEMPA